jgi:hypothetical protein
MTQDDICPAKASATIVWSDTDAEARISQYTSGDGGNPIYGMAGLLFRNYDQLCRCLRDLGWHVDLPVYIVGPGGTTYIGTIKKDQTELRMVVHAEVLPDPALVVNVGPVKGPK